MHDLRSNGVAAAEVEAIALDGDDERVAEQNSLNAENGQGGDRLANGVCLPKFPGGHHGGETARPTSPG
jgi:hypothetical protein